MKDDNIHLEWQKLCEEHEAARSAYLSAFAAVNQKFIEIGSGASRTNPSIAELSRFEETWKVWDDVKQRMSDFVKTHA